MADRSSRASARGGSPEGDSVVRKWMNVLPAIAAQFHVGPDVLELIACDSLRAELRLLGPDTLEVVIRAHLLQESPIRLSYSIQLRWYSRSGVVQWRFNKPDRAVYKIMETQCFEILEQIAPLDLESKTLRFKREARWAHSHIRVRLSCATAAAGPIWYRLEVTFPLLEANFTDLTQLPCTVVTLLDERVELDRERLSSVVEGWARIAQGLKIAEQVGE